MNLLHGTSVNHSFSQKVKVLFNLKIIGERRFYFEMDQKKYSYDPSEREVLLIDGFACKVVEVVDKNGYTEITLLKKRSY